VRARRSWCGASRPCLRDCQAAARILEPLSAPLTTVPGQLRQVPEDLGEGYELVYAFIRRGGKLPVLAPVDRRGTGTHLRLPRPRHQRY
jgi:hypothetical protein